MLALQITAMHQIEFCEDKVNKTLSAARAADTTLVSSLGTKQTSGYVPQAIELAPIQASNQAL